LKLKKEGDTLMTKEKIREVLDIYRKRFSKHKGLKCEYDHNDTIFVGLQPYSTNQVINHTFSMIDKIEEFIEEDRIEKAFRWLGFIQGCMWATGLYTIEELKNHNRPSK
jgi:hypothetical protein